MATAHSDGKTAPNQALRIEEYDYVHVNYIKVSEIFRNLAAGSPDKVVEGPIPGRDYHPHCRSTIRARVE